MMKGVTMKTKETRDFNSGDIFKLIMRDYSLLDQRLDVCQRRDMCRSEAPKYKQWNKHSCLRKRAERAIQPVLCPNDPKKQNTEVKVLNLGPRWNWN